MNSESSDRYFYLFGDFFYCAYNQRITRVLKLVLRIVRESFVSYIEPLPLHRISQGAGLNKHLNRWFDS